VGRIQYVPLPPREMTGYQPRETLVRLLRVLLCLVVLVPLFAAPAAAGVGMTFWQFVTSAAQNITLDDCNARAARALAAAGLSQERHNGSDGSAFHAEWFGTSSGNSSVYISCYTSTANTTTVTFVVASIPNAAGSTEQLVVMQEIRDGFFGNSAAPVTTPPIIRPPVMTPPRTTGDLPVPPKVAPPPIAPNTTNNWMITMIGCVDGFSQQITAALTQAPNGSISGQLFGKFANAQKADIDPGSSRFANGGVHIVANPDGWVSNLEFTGQWDGSKFAGRMHHYTSDDCNFTMTRT